MRNRLVLSTAFLGLFLMVACEKVIEIPLNDADREIVVEGVGRNFLGESYVLLSRSGSVYDDGGFEVLSGAIVKVMDKDGVETIFTEDPLQAGKYISPTFQVTPNNKYTLNVNVEGLAITAESTSKTVPTLDSLTFIKQFGGFGPTPGDTSYLLFYNFVDNVDEENYYRVSAWVNGAADENFYIGDDALGNGQLASAPLFATTIKSKDTVFVELLSMDEASYKYLLTLSGNLSAGPFSASPANPVSNMSQGLGYYSTYMIDTMTIIIP